MKSRDENEGEYVYDWFFIITCVVPYKRGLMLDYLLVYIFTNMFISPICEVSNETRIDVWLLVILLLEESHMEEDCYMLKSNLTKLNNWFYVISNFHFSISSIVVDFIVINQMEVRIFNCYFILKKFICEPYCKKIDVHFVINFHLMLFPFKDLTNIKLKKLN